MWSQRSCFVPDSVSCKSECRMSISQPHILTNHLSKLSLSGALPFLRTWVMTSPKTYTLVSGVGPPALAAIFSYFLPRLTRPLSKYMGAYTYARLDRVVIARYFAFTTISQLVIFTVIGVIYSGLPSLAIFFQLSSVTLRFCCGTCASFANPESYPKHHI